MATLVVGLLIVAIPAGAVHDLDLFELEGNAVDDLTDGDDWETLFDNGGHDFSLVPDFTATGANDTTYFTGGGSKDVRDLPLWQYSANDQSPDKNEITNAYAASYDSSGDMIVYFGADRFANDGDATIGFWFFQDEVGLDGNGHFTGTHTAPSDGGTPSDPSDDNPGDVLVVSDFTNGGNIPNIKVYEWIGGKNPLDLVVDSNQASCGSLANDDACAITNADPEDAPWDYAFKGAGSVSEFPRGTFYEGGINITDLVGGQPCFASFMSQTRSSTSTSAQLKDFTLGGFQACSFGTTLTVSGSPTTVKTGDTVTWTFSERNDGNGELEPFDHDNNNATAGIWIQADKCDAAPISVDVAENSGAGDGFNDGDADDDGKLDGGETWLFSCTYTVTNADATAGSIMITATGHGWDPRLGLDVTYCTNGPGTGGEGINGNNQYCDLSERNTATVTVINPGTELTKTVTSLTITYSYTEENKGDTPLLPIDHDSDSSTPAVFVVDDKCSSIAHVLGSSSDSRASDTTHNIGDDGGLTSPVAANANNDKLDPREKWEFTCTTTVTTGLPAGATGSATITNTATGHGLDPTGADVTWVTGCVSTATLVCDNREQDSVSIQITNNAHPSPSPSST